MTARIEQDLGEMIGKLHQAEIDISAELGNFRLFAVFSRPDAPGKYDLLASAPWGDKNGELALRNLLERLKERLLPEEIRKIPRVIWFDPDDPGLTNTVTNIVLNLPIAVTNHAQMIIQDCNFNNMLIDSAAVFALDKSI